MKNCPDCNTDKDEKEFIYGKRVLVRCLQCQNKQRCEKRKVSKEKAKETTKVCKSCNTEKNGAEFEFGTLLCKPCFSEKDKEANHRPSEADPDKTCRICNVTKLAMMFRKRELVCKDCTTEKLYKWREKNKERFLEICKTYRDKDEKKELRNQNRKKKYAEDIKFKLVQLYRTRVRLCIKQKFYPVNTAFDYAGLLGCEWTTLIQWLEFNMKSGMTWENYGPYWHVDHVYPCSLFDFSQDSERIKCFNWTNLTPLESIENIKKGDRLDIDLIHYYRKRAIEFMQQEPNIKILTDSLPEDIKLLVKSGALPTKDAVKAASGSEEKSEV